MSSGCKKGEEHGRGVSGGLMLRVGEAEPETGSGIMSKTRRRPRVILRDGRSGMETCYVGKG